MLYEKRDFENFAFYIKFSNFIFQCYRARDRRSSRMDCTFLPALSTWESRRIQPTEHSSIALIMQLTRCHLLRKQPPEAKFPVFSRNGTFANLPSSYFFFFFFRREQKRSLMVTAADLVTFSRIYIPSIITCPSGLPGIPSTFNNVLLSAFFCAQ